MLCYRLTDTALYVTWDGDTVYCAESPKAEDLQAFFENEAWQKCGYELQEDILRLAEKGISMQGMGFDISLAAYLAEPTRSNYDLETLCITYLGKELSAEETQTDEDGQIAMNFGNAENRQADADAVAAIFALWQYFAEKLKRDGQSKLYYEVELPLAEVLADMQMTGMYVDKEALSEFGEMLKLRIHETEEEIYRLAGEEFNINSPKQLGEILFGKLKLPGGKKNKNGYSTNVDELNRLAESHPIAEKILLFRRYSKLDSTYVEGLLPLIRKSTGRLHSKFRQTVTATGRISSTEPNLQNIPVRTELGRELRKMFAAEGEDACFVDADYSQIELRVLADITGDEAMCDAFRNGEDIHAKTAARVAGVPLDRVTPKMRSDAKAVNFGIVYGIGAFSLAQDLHISRKEADEYIKGYLMQYPKVAAYRTETVEKAKEQGYVTTKFGRRRNMPELKSSNHITRAFGERVALNAPIQGTAADIIKIAMVRVHQRLKQEVPSAKLVLQVHDELIIECPVAESERVKSILRDEMEHACELSVPLVVDMNVGKSWYDTK